MKLNGPGKYDDACTVAREATNASGVALIVIGGDRGDGFSVQANAAILITLPSLLRRMADSIDKQMTES
jgi:hypothetical protein